MNGNTMLTDLLFGAEACLRNSERLLSDAEKLLGENGNISSFLLYLSAVEEIGKANILAEKVKEGQHITPKEWQEAKIHVKKLCEFQKARDSLDAQIVRMLGLDFDEALDNMAKSLGSKDIQSHRQRRAGELHSLRLAENYVDFHNGKWFEPEPLDKTHVMRAIIIVRNAAERMKNRVKLLGKKGVKP